VINELRRKYPDVRIIAMSGGGHVSRDQYLKIAKGLGAHALLEKPFSNEDLLAAISALTPPGQAPAAKSPPAGV
jgi:CheY-like chemotaxis protein